MASKLTRDDELAIELAAERRRHEARERAEFDARRAELPRTFAAARREQMDMLRALWRTVTRRLR